MKKIVLLLLIVPFFVYAQTSFPSYTDVLIEFYKHYNYSKDMMPNAVNFAKMKDGWHCQVVDQVTEEVKTDEIFWEAKSNQFIPLAAFEGPDEIEIENNVKAALDAFGTFYSFDRCRYYGYPSWTEDMIRDYGSGDKNNYTDTLLDGLARAYSGYASKFLWYQYGGKDETGDSLKQKLQPLQIPSKQRIDSVNFYIGKAIETYKILAAKNPRYMSVVGNAAMKVFNEQMNGYMQMMMAGYNDLAKNYINSIEPNATIEALAQNYLNSCPPYSILFTYGDNDTYPLSYLQEKQNFRKDVAVINCNLLGLPIYLQMLQTNHVVNFSTTQEFYGSPAFLYFIKTGEETKATTLAEFVKAIQNNTYPYQSEIYGGMAGYPFSDIIFYVDLARFAKIKTQRNLQQRIKINLPAYILNDQLIQLDIINTNLYSRPVFLTGPNELFPNYLQPLGLVNQFLPLDTTANKLTEKISALAIKAYLLKTYQPTPGNNFSTGLVADYGVDGNAYALYCTVANYYTANNQKDSALFMLNHLLKAYNNRLPFTLNKYLVGAAMMDAGRQQDGLRIVMEFIEEMLQLHKKPVTHYPYISRKMVLNTAIEIQLLFETHHADRTRIDEIVKLMNRDWY